MSISFNELNKLWGNPYAKKLDTNYIVGEICIDSRVATNGCFFVPLVGENFDGHNFLEHAANAGAQHTVIADYYRGPIPSGLTYWRVKDTLKAFQQLASLHRSKLSCPVIAITGSVGKTTTRELVRASLAKFGNVLATDANNNNDIGVPLTLLKGNSQHKAIIIEMGMRGLGEIERLSHCVQPDLAIITNIGHAHIGRLGTKRNIAIAKAEITSYLKNTGTLFIPDNDDLLEDVLRVRWSGRIIRLGIQKSSSSNSKDIFNKSNLMNLDTHKIGMVDKSLANLTLDGEHYQLPLPGLHNARNFMFALAVATELGYKTDTLNEVRIEQSIGRNRCIKKGEITILDESYNSSPESVEASLALLVTKPGRHFAVLGTMLELGSKSIDLHRQVISKAVEVGLDGLIIFSEGLEAEAMFNEASRLPFCSVHNNIEDLAIELKSILRDGDNLLIKASRKVELERLIRYL